MNKKLAVAALALFGGVSLAAEAVVWNNGETPDIEAVYSTTYTYGSTASCSADTSGGFINLTMNVSPKSTSVSTGAGYLFGWKEEDGTLSLSAYKGACITYAAEQPFRVDFKQSNIKDDNYYGMEMAAADGFKSVFVAFEDLSQGWKSTTTVAWNATLQQAIQFSYKDTHQKKHGETNVIQISKVVLGTECETFPTRVLEPYTTEGAETLVEGDTLTFDLSKIFADDDGDALARVSVIEGKSLVVVDTDTEYSLSGSVKVAAASNVSGEAALKFFAYDGIHDTVSYTVVINVEDSENAPVAVDDSFETDEEVTLKVPVKSSVMMNDYDIDGDDFVPTLVSTVSHGELSFDEETGTFVYTPEKDFYGEDSFTYQLTEIARASDPEYAVKTGNVAKVTIKVNNVDDPAVVVVNDSSITVESVAARLGDTLVYDEDFEEFSVKIPMANIVFSDPDGASNLTIGAKSEGIVNVEFNKLGANYLLSVSSVLNANGLDEVRLYAFEGTDTVSVSFFVKVNPVADNPLVVADSFEVVSGKLLEVSSKKGVLANDVNPDDPSVALKVVLGEDVAHGELEISEDGSFTYTSEVGFVGEDSFTYMAITDDEDELESEYVKVVLNVIEDMSPVVAIDASTLDTTVNEDFTTTLKYTAATVKSWFTSPSGSTMTYKAESRDSLLLVTMSTANLLQVKSVKNACGEDDVLVTATDKAGLSTTLSFHVTINCVNDRPTVKKSIDTLLVAASGWTEKIALDSLFTDVDDDTLTYTLNFVHDMLSADIVDDTLVVTLTDEEDSLADKIPYRVKVCAKDAAGDSVVKTFVFLKGEAESIPVLATVQGSWTSAIGAASGYAVMFDMQGRVMWKSPLPVSESSVRAAAAIVQGRKILRVNSQAWKIK